MQPGKLRDSLDEETTNWRAVCGKTARTVRRAGSAKADPDPYHKLGRGYGFQARRLRPSRNDEPLDVSGFMESMV